MISTYDAVALDMSGPFANNPLEPPIIGLPSSPIGIGPGPGAPTPIQPGPTKPGPTKPGPTKPKPNPRWYPGPISIGIKIPKPPPPVTVTIQWATNTFSPCSPSSSSSSGSSASTAGSFDPNAMIGPSGYGPSNFISGAAQAPLPYQIDFENSPTATAPAQQVVITDTLDPNLDLSTFQLTGIAFGDTVLAIPPGTRITGRRCR